MEWIVNNEQLAAIVAKYGGDAISMRFENGTPFIKNVDAFLRYKKGVVAVDELIHCRDCKFKKRGDSGTFCSKNMTLTFNPDGYCHEARKEQEGDILKA